MVASVHRRFLDSSGSQLKRQATSLHVWILTLSEIFVGRSRIYWRPKGDVGEIWLKPQNQGGGEGRGRTLGTWAGSRSRKLWGGDHTHPVLSLADPDMRGAPESLLPCFHQSNMQIFPSSTCSLLTTPQVSSAGSEAVLVAGTCVHHHLQLFPIVRSWSRAGAGLAFTPYPGKPGTVVVVPGSPLFVSPADLGVPDERSCYAGCWAQLGDSSSGGRSDNIPTMDPPLEIIPLELRETILNNKHCMQCIFQGNSSYEQVQSPLFFPSVGTDSNYFVSQVTGAQKDLLDFSQKLRTYRRKVLKNNFIIYYSSSVANQTWSQISQSLFQSVTKFFLVECPKEQKSPHISCLSHYSPF